MPRHRVVRDSSGHGIEFPTTKSRQSIAQGVGVTLKSLTLVVLQTLSDTKSKLLLKKRVDAVQGARGHLARAVSRIAGNIFFQGFCLRRTFFVFASFDVPVMHVVHDEDFVRMRRSSSHHLHVSFVLCFLHNRLLGTCLFSSASCDVGP